MNLRSLALAFLTAAPALAQLPSVGPDYQTPEPPVPATFRNPSDSARPLAADWWNLFNDPVLTDLLQRVETANSDLHAAAARIAQAEAILRTVRADFFPRLDFTGSATRADVSTSRSFSSLGGSGSGLQDPANEFNVGVALSYELDLWGRVRRSARAALADWQSSQALASAVHLSLKTQAARTYFALRSVEDERSALNRATETRREALSMTKSRQDAGLGSELNTARAQTELSLAESDSTALLQQRAELLNALAVLAGEHASAFQLRESPRTKVPVIPSGVPADLLRRRPDISAAERRLAAAAERIGVAKSEFYPSVKIGAQLGMTAPETEKLHDRDSRDASIGVTVTIPIWDNGIRKAQVDRARAIYDEQESAFRQTVLVAAQEAENSLSAQRVLAKQEAQNSTALVAARRAAELTRSRQGGGIDSNFEVVDADRTALQIERTAARLRGLRLAAAVDLIRALGGGWTPAAPLAETPAELAAPAPVSVSK